MKKDLKNKLIKLISQGESPDFFMESSQLDKELDDYFGINYLKVEALIQEAPEYIYKNHLSEALLTSYLDYYQILKELGPKKILCDLGAGYCRGSLLSEKDPSLAKCISIEVQKNRIEEALKLIEDKSLLLNKNLLDPLFKLPIADAYFIYLPTGEVLNSIFRKIKEQNIEAVFYFIESHGDLIETVEFYPELFSELVSNLKVSSQRHDLKVYKYQSLIWSKKRPSFNELDDLNLWLIYYSNRESKVLIESKVAGTDKKREWIGSLYKARYLNYNGEVALQLENPFRILQLETQDKLVEITQA